MEFDFPYVELLRILSYLVGISLLQAAQVNKDWNAIASSDILWKKLCVKRWHFCEDVTPQLLGTKTWKQFSHYKIWQEHTKSRVKPEDFTYKEIYTEITVYFSTFPPNLTREKHLDKGGKALTINPLLNSLLFYIEVEPKRLQFLASR
uniref:F-box/WD repeat-containing protein 15-like n=1 Tax=Arvicanthis niloticus TaxID=61156 RepID=UPI0014863981|nr:F-box/WD repeat-containing protein 15-like [Arvicanthis niloticus]